MGELKIFINNNPKFKTTIESIVKEEVWDIDNSPYIKVNGEGFEDGQKNIEVYCDDKLLMEGIVLVKKSTFNLKVDLKETFKSMTNIKVIIDREEYNIPVQLKRLYGRVTYFDGTPVKNPIALTNNDIKVIGNEEGYYEICLAEKEEYIAIFNEDYSKEALECWLYDVNLIEDMELNVSIDKFEIYRLHGWYGEHSVNIHFVPMSLTKVLENMKYISNESSKNDDIWPQVSEEDIKVYIGNIEQKIVAFKEVEDFLYYENNGKTSRQAYLISIAKETIVNDVIKVVISNKTLKDNKEIIEKGESYYFGFLR
ncbi:hypothetical protein U732_381 [Clostridium argentinense CDC 2741]|uniref:Uncharacterized protein n=1 Tax=Clostridium argentinense CDC 2741 TaxID=1418104 RepID=A0A0C1QV03_9CLOT|nr:hypothetical protein [Clostridium argentinense]ARC83878.1 hypothetical protein RSJ17_04705 [Clostridium argentinense]KIE44862.1 hypothetical protein U732_381 [Clostridium argentinense CDC 2741]NFF39787.1 hypothetical protein [Clostridium argentinense]NFP49787.1 hypothetical protein [Clostridium argentinense]NFP72188.1 hypothetical protein [Clostridium argentinense]